MPLTGSSTLQSKLTERASNLVILTLGLYPGLRETAESLVAREMAEMGGLSSEHPRMPQGPEKDLFEVCPSDHPCSVTLAVDAIVSS